MLNKKEKGVVKGAPSGFVVSLLVHAAAFLLAGMLVVFNVVKKEEKKFVPPKAVERPKMNLKKPKVKVRKSSKPKPTTRIVTRVKRASMPDIQLPEMSGMGDGLAGGIGGFEIMPDLSQVSVFGGNQSIGNDFEGRFYDLKRDRRGGTISMEQDPYMTIVGKLAREKMKESLLGRYYRAPNKLFTTHFMIPPITSPMAPDVYGSPETASFFFLVKYTGKLVYKDDIRFRFWGTGDAYCVVTVDDETVLINGWDGRLDYLTHWTSPEPGQSDQYFCGNQLMKVGEWIDLKAGEPKDMKVIFGEYTGGQMGIILLVEVEGMEYPKSRQGGPILPAFKTEEFSRDMLEEIYKLLPEGECVLTNGPVFRDF
ncbi:hypothetical protein [Pontiella sulfatireligans]|uniref:PA14 domain-containing protein n=1 Tax=Pontiella sulfatireligans TaxID=2750658 RepID=A0A6C2UPR5_9BACT|nr:hypothetical protein [Pontiella sulfatireligans]VGO22290.1 hypothetical protein SCARR_04372 [Pontiella sulfatireligans]